MAFEKPVIIIGAGVVGLSLAHGLKKAGIPFNIYERDESIDSRGQGWAITLHWVLPFLKQLLEPDVYEAVSSVQVDPEVGRNDTGNFLFINLATEEPKFRIPPNDRRRVNREKLRRLLLQGVKDRVRWSSKLVDIVKNDSSPEITAVFDDGTRVAGPIIIGAEGSNSRTRRFLKPDQYENYHLPVRFVGSAMDMSPDQVRPLRQLDPLLFQGCHPDTGTFLWVSMLEVPEINGTKGTPDERYRVQINLSWPVNEPDDEVKTSDAERLAQMKQKAIGFSPMLKSAVDSIPDGVAVQEIKLADWPCYEWDGQNGMVTLVGDAAHAMTMYRGEAANHGILDAFNLYKALQSVHSGETAQKEALEKYETEMRERTKVAVLLSRQACLDAHDWSGLDANSAVLKRRAIVAN